MEDYSKLDNVVCPKCGFPMDRLYIHTCICEDCNMEATIVNGEVEFEYVPPVPLDTERNCPSCGADMDLVGDEFICPKCGDRMSQDDEILFEKEYQEMTADYDRKPDPEDDDDDD